MTDKYEGFPYLTFIEKDIQKELNFRFSQDTRIRNINAWVKVTSGVQQTKATTSRSEIAYTDGRLYSLQSFMSIQSSSVGYDFNEIYDPNDNRPRAGITSIDVKYLSKYGGVRTATIKWQVNSLQQFQEYAPYFLNPGRTMLLEWGWTNSSSSIYELSRAEYEDLKSNKSLEAWEYLNNRSIKSRGLYDGMLGMVTNYDFSLRDDGGFDITTEVTSQGTMMYGLNLVHQSNVAGEGNNTDVYQTTIKNFVKDELNDVVANWPKVSDKLLSLMGQTKTRPDVDVFVDTEAKTKSNKFVTWGFIEDIVVNPWIGIRFGKKSDGTSGKPLFQLRSLDTSDFYTSGNEVGFRSVKISNHEELRTTNLSTCFINNGNGTVNDATRKALRFNEPADGVLVDKSEMSTGYLRNIYVNLNLVHEAFEGADTLTDALLKILNEISMACIQYWDFNLKINEKDQTLRVIDANYTDKFLKKLIDNNTNTDSSNILSDIYLFRAYGGNGTVKGISFSSKLSNDIKITSLYANNKNDDDNYVINNDSDAFRSIWNNGKVYTDYFYDKLYYVTKNRDDSLSVKNDQKVDIHSIWEDDVNKEFGITVKDAFLPSAFKGDEINDMKLKVYGKTKTEDQKSNLVVPADFEMTLEGISGIRIGDVFWVDAVPDVYLENTVFQATGVDHSVENNYWTTTIKGMLKVSSVGVTAAQIKSDPSRKGITVSKIKQLNISKNISNPDNKVLKWIKNNMSSFIKSSIVGTIFTEDIIAGLIYAESEISIRAYYENEKADAYTVNSQVQNTDATGHQAYSLYQLTSGKVTNEIQSWLDSKDNRWQRPGEATQKAISLLRTKQTTIKQNHPELSPDELLRATIAAYNAGEGTVNKALSNNIPLDNVTYDPVYLTKIYSAAEKYKTV